LSPFLLAAIVAIVGALMACYWGAGVIMFPPKMSRMTVFPEQFGLRYEKADIKTRDGLTLRGWFIPSPNGAAEKRTILMCHGWGDNKGELLKVVHFLNDQSGFNLFFFDFRSHGESDGEMTTMGYYEIVDFDAAMRWLKENKPWAVERLGVFGLSMGAAVTSMAMQDHPELKCAVLESPFTDYQGVVRRWGWNNFKIPYFPLIIVTLWLLRLRVGVKEVTTYSPSRFIAKIAPRPILMIGGEKDDLMTEPDVRALFAVAKDPKQLWIIPDAVHAKCHQVAGLEYETRVAGFFNRNL
jgi:pimeloyl-ACP methyl ester carboxylesterase